MHESSILTTARRTREAAPHQRVIRATHEGATVWVKQASAPRKSFLLQLHRLLSPCLPPLFRVSGGGKTGDALEQEAQRLRLFAARGIRVPAVLAEAPGLLVLGDVGMQLQVYLGKLPDDAARDAVLRQAATELAKMHRAGLAHGRPFTKDMAWQDGAISFFDFEQDPAGVMSLPQAQARDIWLFLNGAVRFTGGDAARLKGIFDAYRQNADAAVLAELKKLAALVRPLRLILTPFLPVAGKDAFRAVTANRMLENTLE